MGINEAIADLRQETGMSQRELAEQVYMDRSQISRIENGKAEWPEEHDVYLTRLNWKTALALADERTNGYIENVAQTLDLHPSALKELLLKDLDEAHEVLEEIILATRKNPDKHREIAKRVYFEIKDVEAKGAVFRGVLTEVFGLDRAQLDKEYELQVKKGER